MPDTTSIATGIAPQRLAVTHDEIEVEGLSLRAVELGGWQFGPPLGTAPVALLVGGITATAFPLGDGRREEDGGQAGWWPALFGEARIDPRTTTVLCPEWPGNGSTFAGIDSAGEGPPISVLGLADLVELWLSGIGCDRAVSYYGASLGGLVGVALAARHPKRVAKLVTVSAGLRPDGWGTATRHLQRQLVRDGLRNGDVATGMVRARQLGMLTYRGRHELDTRFGKLTQELASPPVASYLEHHGHRFAKRFPAATFLLLSEAIDRFSLGETRASVRSALEAITAEVVIVGVPGDQLFPWSLQEELHRELQAVGATSSLWKLESDFGHDAFLADQDRLAQILVDAGCFAEASEPAPRFAGVGVEPLRAVRIGLIGCGTVGQGLLEMLARQKDALASRYGVEFAVTRMAVRDVERDRGPYAAGIERTADLAGLVAAEDVDVVVEAAGGVAMEGPVRAALAAGKPVVTANKVLLAAKLAELGVLAQRTATPLSCEAAAAAAIPILRHLSHRADEVERFMGIINGTCNFLITRLEQDEIAMTDAIDEAKRLGLAEQDPSADIDGHDAAAKLSILCYRAFGCWVSPDRMPTRGIREVSAADCDLAEAMGYRLRHIAHGARSGERLIAGVEPLLLPAWHLLASVEEEYNAVYMSCASSGDLSLFGKGAGGLPTATAILGDLIDLAQNNTMRWPEPLSLALEAPDVGLRRHYVRISAEDHAGLSRRVESHVRRAGLSVQSRASRREGDSIHLGFVLSPSSGETLRDVEASILGLGRVESVLILGVMGED